MLYRYITNLYSGVTIPVRSEKSVIWIWPFLLTQPLSIFIRLDRRSTYVLTMLRDYVLGQFMCCTFPLGFLSTFPRHPSRFYCTLVALQSRPRAFVPRLYCVLSTLSAFALSSYCTIDTFNIPKLSNELLPSVCICNFISWVRLLFYAVSATMAI